MKTKDPADHPWYKVYDIKDYKKMQREVRLNRGTLGPDLDTENYKEKVGLLFRAAIQNDNIQMKNHAMFLTFPQNIDCGYSFGLPYSPVKSK